MPREKKINTATYSGRVSARIRALRLERGLDMERLRDALNRLGFRIKLSTLYGWENGNKRPNPDKYPALAKALGCKSVRDFLPEN